MSWSEYSSTATTNHKELMKRIRQAAFHFKGPHVWESTNFETKTIEETTEIVEFDFIDLAVLLGIRDTCYQQQGDAPLSKEEVHRFNEILNRQNVIYNFILPVEEERTQTTEELCDWFDEWEQRLVTAKITETEEGGIQIFLNVGFYMSLWRALTMLYPGSEIDVWNYEDYNDCEEWCEKYDRYLVKFGTAKQIDHKYDKGLCDWREEDSELEPSNETPSVYEIGMQYAYSGDYEKSTEVLSTLKDNTNALNNIGVNYERLKNYEKAYEYYLKANTPWSLDNLLALYNTSKIPMNVEDYIRVCEKLIELGDDHGYIYLSKLYYQDHPGVPVNEKLAIKYAKEGYEAYPKSTFAIFNYAWCLLEFGKTDEDKVKSHDLFGSILWSKNDRDEDIYPIAKYNYAWQCQEGIGCEVDISKAIYWYIRSFEEDDIKAAWQLGRIYKTYEGYINQEAANFWYQQYIEAGGEDDE